MVGQEKHYALPHGTVMVWMAPRFQEILEGEYKGEIYDWGGKGRIQVFIDRLGFQPIDNLGAACIKITEYCVELDFYRGMYVCMVRVNNVCLDRADMPKYEKLVRYFANIVAKKMPAIVIEKPK
ncbi:hypothetical protein ES705_49038 [subsurface metagenome]